MSRTRSIIAAGVVMALGGSAVACTPDTEATDALEAEIVDLRADLEERQQAEAALVERLDGLEQALAEAAEDEGTPDRLDAVDEELGRVIDELTALEAELVEESSARERLAGDVEAGDEDLRGGLAELRGELNSVRGSVGLLSDQLEVLRERVDRSSG